MRSSDDPKVRPAVMAGEVRRLLEFARAARVPGGFGWLDDDGRPAPRDPELWITCRMTHVAALGHLLGRPGFADLAEHGVTALRTAFRDQDHGGWFAAVAGGAGGEQGPADDRKQAYGHAFVILAASSAAAAGTPGAPGLLDEALALFDLHFWDPDAGLARESFDRSFTLTENYRGLNANMHTVEAYLAAADVTGERLWLDRAVQILTWALDRAREYGWRMPEHFGPDWDVQWEYNTDHRADPFRPYGVTPGHALEWARLALSAVEALTALGDVPPPWIAPAAVALADRAVTDGWAVDGADGFVYTTDFDGQPVVRERMHWVLAEALGAALALYRHTGDERWNERFALWWDYADRYLVDRERGSWHHELDPQNRPAATTWAGKPDVYHALQAMLLPDLPLSPSFATALKNGQGR